MTRQRYEQKQDAKEDYLSARFEPDNYVYTDEQLTLLPTYLQKNFPSWFFYLSIFLACFLFLFVFRKTRKVISGDSAGITRIQIIGHYSGRKLE